MYSLSEQSFRTRLSLVLLILLNAAILLGIVAGLEVGRPRFFGMTVIAGLAIVVLDLMVYYPKSEFKTRRHPFSGITRQLSFLETVLKDRRTTMIAFLANILVLILVGRGLLHYITISVFFTSIITHIYVSDERNLAVGTNLALQAIGAASILGSQVLTVAYYARTRDTIKHVGIARRIVNFETIEAMLTTRYLNLPVFHIVASIGTRVTDLDVRLFSSIFVILIFLLAIVGVFTIFRNLAGSKRIALLGTAFLSFNPEFISWGTQVHPQSLSFVFMIVYLSLLTSATPNIWFKLIAGGVAVAWVMTHHFTIFMAVFFISVPVLAPLAWDLFTDSEYRSVVKTLSYHLFTLTGVVLVYWTITGIISLPVSWIFVHSPAASAGGPTHILINIYSDPTELMAASIPFVISILHYVFFLAISAYALIYIFQQGRLSSDLLPPVVVLSFFVGTALYVPNPLWIPLEGVAALNRWGLMALPFILLIPSVGLKMLASDSRQKFGMNGVTVLVVVVVITSIGAGFSDPSLNELGGYDKGERKYFTNENLAAAGHVLEYSTDARVSSDPRTSGYLEYESWTELSAVSPGIDPDRYETMVVQDNELRVRPGLTVFHTEAFRDKGIRAAFLSPGIDTYDEGAVITAPISDETVDVDMGRRNVVYANGDSVILYGASSGPAVLNSTA